MYSIIPMESYFFNLNSDLNIEKGLDSEQLKLISENTQLDDLTTETTKDFSEFDRYNGDGSLSTIALNDRLEKRKFDWIYQQEEYNCHACPKKYSHLVNLRHHIKVKHEGKNYICKPCNKEFSPSSYYSHLKKEHVKDLEDKYKCSECPKKYTSKKDLTAHICEKHLECVPCGKNYSTKKGFDKHMKLEHAHESYDCDQCDQNFLSKTMLKNHKKNDHLKKCNLCDRTFIHKTSLTRHIQNDHKI